MYNFISYLLNFHVQYNVFNPIYNKIFLVIKYVKP